MIDSLAPQDTASAAANVNEMLRKDAFSRWLGVELVSLSPGACTLRMRVREEMLNGFGVSHGGIVFSLADSAMAFACKHRLAGDGGGGQHHLLPERRAR
jgi:acyl-CoA thioesterase